MAGPKGTHVGDPRSLLAAPSAPREPFDASPCIRSGFPEANQQEASELVDGIVRELKDAGGSVRGGLVRAPVATGPPRTILDVAEEEGGDSPSWHPGALGLGPAARGSVAHKSSTSPTSRC